MSRKALDLLELWIKSPDAEILNVEPFAEIRSIVIKAIYGSDHEKLLELHHSLTPLSKAATKKLRDQNIPKWSWQASEIPVLATLARSALFIMERVDPKQALRLINHGPTVLNILSDLNKRRPLFENRIFLRDIREYWPSYLDYIPSESTISRTLAALEESGFIQRIGATKGRRYRLLPKAEKLGEEQNISLLKIGLEVFILLSEKNIKLDPQADPEILDELVKNWPTSPTPSKESLHQILSYIIKSGSYLRLEGAFKEKYEKAFEDFKRNWEANRLVDKFCYKDYGSETDKNKYKKVKKDRDILKRFKDAI